MDHEETTAIEKRDRQDLERKLIAEIKSENSKAVNLLRRIGQDQRDFIISRWKMGRSIDELMGGQRGQYGSKIATYIADETGLHQNVVYECRRFYLATPDGPDAWIDSVVSRNGIVLWRNVRQLISQHGQEETLGEQGAIERRLHNIERRAEKLEQDMQEVARSARSNGVGVDLKEDVLGVADRVLEVTRTGFAGHSKELTPRDDRHLDYVRNLACAFCGANPPSEPHHVEKVATGMQGNDYSCVPVCRQCHDDIHQMGNQSFQVDRNVAFGEAIAQTLVHRMCGQHIKLPKRPRLA